MAADGTPKINLTGARPNEVLRKILDALADEAQAGANIYRMAGELVTLDISGRTPVLRMVGDGALDALIHDVVDFTRGDLPTEMPARYLARIRARMAAFAPEALGVVQTPFFRPDGSLVSFPGYDKKTRLIYWPPSGVVDEYAYRPTSAAPSREEAAEAAARILGEKAGRDGPLVDFPFVDDASRANMLGLILTPFIRPMIGGGNVPLALLDAPAAGSGKTLLANVFSVIATGQPAATISWPESEPEMRKEIVSYLLAGHTVIVIDNVMGRVQSAPLEQALTTRQIRARILGRSESVDVENAATWMLTGNNITPAGDMVRRVYPIRIDAQVERPYERRTFRIENLEAYLVTHRPQLVRAALTMISSWVAAGKPGAPVTAPVMGSFEAWSRIIAGILEHAGVPDFLQNLKTLRGTLDTDTDELAVFLRALYAHTEGGPFFLRTIAAELADSQDFGRGVGRALYEALPSAVSRDGRSSPGELSKRIGQYFGYRTDRVADGYRVRRTGGADGRTAEWIVERVHTSGGSSSIQASMQFGESAPNDTETPF